MEDEASAAEDIPPVPPLPLPLATNLTPGEAAAAFPPLKKIWEDQYCQTCDGEGHIAQTKIKTFYLANHVVFSAR